jgi:hypothetical protein
MVEERILIKQLCLLRKSAAIVIRLTKPTPVQMVWKPS